MDQQNVSLNISKCESRIDPPVRYVSGLRSWSVLVFSFRFGVVRGAVLGAGAVVSGFKDVAMMGKLVQQRCGHFGIAENAGPFADAQVRGCDNAGAPVELAQQVEGQCSDLP